MTDKSTQSQLTSSPNQSRQKPFPHVLVTSETTIKEKQHLKNHLEKMKETKYLY